MLSFGEDSSNLSFELGRCFYAIGWAFMLTFCVRVVNFWSVIPVIDKYFDRLLVEVQSKPLCRGYTAIQRDKLLIDIKLRRAESYNKTALMLNCARWLALAIVISQTWGRP
jgi:hypothetical protein